MVTLSRWRINDETQHKTNTRGNEREHRSLYLCWRGFGAHRGEAKRCQTGAYQTFSVDVPAEKNSPTVSVKLDTPESLTDVTPTVKPGWTIKVDKHGEGEDAMVTAITWSGGEIGAGYRDEFTFSAKTPDQPADLQWKAYQTYGDGTTVSWDQQPTSANSEDKDDATTARSRY